MNKPQEVKVRKEPTSIGGENNCMADRNDCFTPGACIFWVVSHEVYTFFLVWHSQPVSPEFTLHKPQFRAVVETKPRGFQKILPQSFCPLNLCVSDRLKFYISATVPDSVLVYVRSCVLVIAARCTDFLSLLPELITVWLLSQLTCKTIPPRCCANVQSKGLVQRDWESKIRLAH